MKTIRRNVFETNSSSSHSLAVPQNFNTYNIRKRKLIFHLGSFGRPCRTVKVKPTDYLYTAIIEGMQSWLYNDGISKKMRDTIEKSKEVPNWKPYCKEILARLDKLKAILDSYGLKYEFEDPVWDVEYEWDNHKSYGFIRDIKYARKIYYNLKDMKTGKKENTFYYTDRSFGIDHADEVEPIVDMLLSNPEECIKFLLGGMVFVGSDEADDVQQAKIHWNEKTYSETYYFDFKKNKEVKRWNKNTEWRERTHTNPYYMEGYNYYHKGN